jgi:putative transposase
MAAENLPVQVACKALGVSESGYYEYRSRAPSERSIRHSMLTDLITQIHLGCHGIYGARRIHAGLTLGHGVVVGHNQVEQLMRRTGLQGLIGRRKWKRIRADDIATDLVERDFNRAAPNQLWLTDITEHPGREGLLLRHSRHLLPSRRRMVDRRVTNRSLSHQRAWDGHRHPPRQERQAGHNHPPRSRRAVRVLGFTQRAKDSGLLASMGSIGDRYDNSMIESFRSRMQVELLDRKKWNTRLELANAIFEYLEIWHNRRRRHSQPG